jgi:UDP-3-O-[3-hydroxymyristoyl] glucosamine N-acyltransferase
VKLSAIAAALKCAVSPSEGEREIRGIGSLDSAGDQMITFVADSRMRDKAAASPAAAFIVKSGEPIENRPCLEVEDPYLGYALCAQLFEDRSPSFGEGVHGSAVIDAGASLAQGVSVGPGSVIGANCAIGRNTRIGARVVIESGVSIGDSCRIDAGAVIRWGCTIGSRTVVQSGAVIGSDGFGNARTPDGFVRIPCFGVVEIGDDVDVGAGATIDRGNFEPTVIDNGVKLDNLIHIAHNVSVGEHTAIAAQTGVSGSTNIGRRVLIGGQAGFVGHIDIGDDSFIGAKAGVSKSVRPQSRVTGYPARDFMTMRRIEAAEAELPGMVKELRRMRKELASLREQLGANNQS